MNLLRRMFSSQWILATLLVLAGLAITIRLGFWQVDRYRLNSRFDQHLAAMQVAAPLVLTGHDQANALTGMEYRAIQATGTFDLGRQVAIRNQIWVQSWGNAIGYILVAPLVLPDGSAILVDRGWIPIQADTPASWHAFDQVGSVTVTGVIRLPVQVEIGGVPNPTLAPGENSLSFWNSIDLGRLQKQLPYPLLPVYIQQAPQADQANPPYRALPVPDTSETDTNAGYAAMWFSFTGLLFFGYPLYLRKQATDKAIH